MYILKGKGTFSLLDINNDEMAMIFDGFNAYRAQLIQLLDLPPNEFSAAFGDDKAKVKMVRSLFQKRIPSLEETIKKIKKHVGS